MCHIRKSIFGFIFLCAVMYVQILSALFFQNTVEMLTFVKSILPKSPIILEAGGHLGEDTIVMKSIWPDATMHVFEPLPSSYELMLKATQHLSNTMCYQQALTSYSGKTNFYIDIQNSGACSIGYPVEWNQHEFDKKPIEVSCITINDWASINKISHIDFMWLDMEGHELYALQNGLTILGTVRAIYTEIDYVPVRVNGCLYTDLKEFLEMQGFIEVWKSNCGRFGNALFIKN